MAKSGADWEHDARFVEAKRRFPNLSSYDQEFMVDLLTTVLEKDVLEALGVVATQSGFHNC
jgi:hypothetical protein